MFAWKFHFYGSSVELRNSFVEDTSALDKKNNKFALTTIHDVDITESYSSQIPHLILGHVDVFILLGSNISYIYGTDSSTALLMKHAFILITPLFFQFMCNIIYKVIIVWDFEWPSIYGSDSTSPFFEKFWIACLPEL